MSDYIPFGPEWKKEMMKWRKSDLVDKLCKQLMEEAGLGPASTPGLSVVGPEVEEKGWTSLDLIYPNIEELVLVYDKNHGHVVAVWNGEDWYIQGDYLQTISLVTHWMPLPSRPDA